MYLRSLAFFTIGAVAVPGLAQPSACSNTVLPIVNDLVTPYVTKSIVDFGAVPNDDCSDQAAFERAAAFFQARGGHGTLAFPAGEFILGREVSMAPAQYLKGIVPLSFSRCEDLHLTGASLVNGAPSTILRFDDCLRYGSFDPATGQRSLPRCAVNCLFVEWDHAAELDGLIVLDRCRDVSVTGIELNGNSDNLTFGGKWGDTGIQLGADGISIVNSKEVEVGDCFIHHMGRDGISVMADTGMVDGPSALMFVTLHDTRMEWNGRNGLWLGGSGVSVSDCSLDYNGFGLPRSAPASGLDIEYHGYPFSPVERSRFENCTFRHNAFCGLITDAATALVQDHRFINCTFVASEGGYAAWADAKALQFDSCHFHGSLVHTYSLPVGEDAAHASVFDRCDFHDEYQGEYLTAQFLINLSGANGLRMNECVFNTSCGMSAFSVWASAAVPAVFTDCIWNYTGNDQYLLINSIFGNAGGCLVSGTFTLNYPAGMGPWISYPPSPGFTLHAETAPGDCPSPLPLYHDPSGPGAHLCEDDIVCGSVELAPAAGCPTTRWSMTTTTDGAGSEITWEVVDRSNNLVVASGGPYGNYMTVTEPFYLPVGCFDLKVHDSGGNGITGGGYVLRDYNGDPQIDNTNNGGTFTSLSQSPGGFCNPVGPDHLRFIDCGNLERLPNDLIQSLPNAQVSAEWGVGNQADDGYEFWFTDPNGTYTRNLTHLHSQATGGYSPADATRASKLYLNWVSTPLPAYKLVNVRVRGIVNGVALPYGPACQLKVDPEAAACHTTQLINDPSSIYLSCGVVGLHRNGSSAIAARPVSRTVPTPASANRYWFHFEIPAEAVSFDIYRNTYTLPILPTHPFVNGATYNVTVRASFDGGTTYCPVGPMCQISFSATGLQEAPAANAAMPAGAPEVLVVPNPNDGDRFLLFPRNIDLSAAFTVEITDLFGRQVRTLSYPGQDADRPIEVRPDAPLAGGLYTISLVTPVDRFSQRTLIH